jgi:acetyl-CoA C-acetyltransferase
VFAEEVVAVEVQDRGGTTMVERDEGIRPDTTAEALAALAPAFTPTGTITAGNASQLSDGAAATVVMSAARAETLGVEPLAEVVAHGMCADRFAYLHTVPAIALEKALKKAGKDIDHLGLVEINEAFASVAVHATRTLGADTAIVNANGGSVALGHALGSTGARMLVTLIHELRRRQVEYGAATLCGGGGQGDALLLRLPTG